jgi:porin
MVHLKQHLASVSILAIGLLLAAFAPPALAQTDEQTNDPVAQASPLPTSSPTSSPYLTGDWGGERTRLEQEGVTFRGRILSEFAGNPAGGILQGTALASELALGTDVNFGKLMNSGAGTLHFTFTARTGSSLSANAIGNVIPVQEIFGDGLTPRLTEFSYDQPLLNGKLDISLGRLITENDFANGPTYWGNNLYCNFDSLGMCGTPVAMLFNSGYVGYPSSAWGARVRVSPTQNWYVQGAAYQVNPTYALRGEGFNLGLGGDTGMFLPYEAGFSFTDKQRTTVGNIRAGGYYDTSVTPVVESQITSFVAPSALTPFGGVPNDFVRGRYGFWFLGDHLIAGSAAPGAPGTVFFVNYEWGDQNTALISNYYDGGFVVHGAIAGRPYDTLTLGYAIANFNSRLRAFELSLQAAGAAVPATGNESVFELNYGIQATPWLTLRPGAQYVMTPSGQRAIQNALVLELSATINF